MCNTKELLIRQNTLRHFMRYDFYPPIRGEVIEGYVDMFTKFWRHEISYEDLVRTCPIGEDELNDRFGFFFYDEERE